MTTLTILGEADAWQALADPGPCSRLIFQDWPQAVIKIDPGDGTVSPQLRHAIDELQALYRRTYCLLKYGEPDMRRLTDQERHLLALRPVVVRACTLAGIDLQEVANTFAREAAKKISGKRLVMIAVALALIPAASNVIGHWLDYRAKVEAARILADAQLESTQLLANAAHEAGKSLAKTSENDLERMKLLIAAAQTEPIINYFAEGYSGWLPALMRVAPLSGSITYNDVTMPSAVAEKLATKPPADAPRWITEVRPEDANPWRVKITKA